jgi:hypothetical protein
MRSFYALYVKNAQIRNPSCVAVEIINITVDLPKLLKILITVAPGDVFVNKEGANEACAERSPNYLTVNFTEQEGKKHRITTFHTPTRVPLWGWH